MKTDTTPKRKKVNMKEHHTGTSVRVWFEPKRSIEHFKEGFRG